MTLVGHGSSCGVEEEAGVEEPRPPSSISSSYINISTSILIPSY